ncbi:MAG: metal-sensitive transcriptional regulator [bacterium]|nr:metal-sensitive transcriptional regulator [bacterium]
MPAPTKTHHHANPETKAKVISRLKKIEGQVRALSKMVEEDVYCDEVLNLFASVKAALNGARDVVLEDHVGHCLAEQMQTDPNKATAELMHLIKKVST